MMRNFLAFGILIFILFQSCTKINETHPEFIGFWKGSTDEKVYTIRVNEDGTGKFSFTGNGKMGNNSGNVRYKNGNLKIGIRNYTVNKEPFSCEDGIKMEVEGIVFDRVD